MAGDISRLLDVLSDYHEVLVAQHRRVADAHAELAAKYLALHAVYDGRGATEFKAGWSRVEAVFRAYDEGVPAVLDLIAGKIDQLRALDQGF